MNRYYDPATAQFLSVDPLVAETQSPYGYVDDNPVNNTDPSGLIGYTSVRTYCPDGRVLYGSQPCNGGSLFDSIGNGLASAWNDSGGQVVHFAYEHPAIAGGIALGVASVATGGLALAAGATVTGVVLGGTAVATGVGATVLDARQCASPGSDRLAACIGASLGGVGAVTGLGATVGAGLVVGGVVAEGSTADIALNGAFAGLSFTSAGAGLAFDSAVGIGSALNGSTGVCGG